MLNPIQAFLVTIVISLPLSSSALPIPNALDPRVREHDDAASKELVSRLEIPQAMCARAVLSRDGKTIRRQCGGGGGGDLGGGDFGGGGDLGGSEGDFGGGGDFGDSSGGGDGSPNQPINIPTVETVGHREDSPALAPIPSGIDPQLVAMNENKGLSWPCALHSVVGGWEAGLACSLLEEKNGKGSVVPPPPPAPKSPAPPPATAPGSPAPAPPPAPAPKAPAPKTPPPAPKSDNSGGARGTGRPGMVP